MRFFLEFLRQKTPRQGEEMPLYYRRALTTTEILLEIYYVICFFLFPLIIRRWEWVPLLFLAVTGGCLWMAYHQGVRINLALFAAVSAGWIWWNVRSFGWNCGVQHFLTLTLVFVFFNVCDKPLNKIIWFFGILTIRIFFFSMSRWFTDTIDTGTLYQTLNSVSFFTMLAAMCIIFSTSIQSTERQLMLKNQTLYKEAGTDPLTGLPNRRSMIETIERFYRESGDQPFSVAIADIDLFKSINDTYGHNCGDYTLVKLTELFVEHAMGRYSVCRWGGEEFCFFLPGMNLDEAGIVMNDLNFAVENMELEYEGTKFSITITIGVEEYDFSSPMEELLNSADEKLYMGKKTGRNRVVV